MGVQDPAEDAGVARRMERGRVAEVVAANVGRTVLIGRGRELDLIANALEVSRTEGLRVVLIVGEAGIGKTRLLTEALADGLRRGALAVVGRCLDERGMPPYMPWINLAASLSGTDAGKSAGQELRALLLDSEDPDPSPATGGMERRRIRLFEAIRDAIAALARRQPVIVGFDDLQWSDPSSNQLLRYLAGRLADAPLLIVGASRVEEMEPNLEFARTRAEFDRKRLLTEIHLRRFEERETGALVASLMGGSSRRLWVRCMP
ncbi:MAG: AAA family ATPase [Thermomicrobiales bacterium]